MTAPDDATRDVLTYPERTRVALARDLWLAEGYDLDADPDGSTAREMRPIYAARAGFLLAAGYLPPDQADALRAERDQANARAEQQAGAVDARLLAERIAKRVTTVEAWRALGWAGQGRLIDTIERDLRAALAPGAADAHDQRVRAEEHPLRAAVEGKAALYARLASEAMDPDVREWMTAFTSTLRELLAETRDRAARPRADGET